MPHIYICKNVGGTITEMCATDMSILLEDPENDWHEWHLYFEISA